MGAEGLSTFRWLRTNLPELPLTLADEKHDPARLVDSASGDLTICRGNVWSDIAESHDLIVKSPGIQFSRVKAVVSPEKISSQTELFLSVYRNQTIGITGTKGKSTTAALTGHLLKESGKDVLLAGNMGIPPFDLIDQIKPETILVYELSSHQLEGITCSPHIALLLNIYQEHLDHYASYRDYQLAKLNIVRWQQSGDYLIYCSENKIINDLLKEFPPISVKLEYGSGYLAQNMRNAEVIGVSAEDGNIFDFTIPEIQALPGDHNRLNIMAALMACKIAGAKPQTLLEALTTFRPLKHRLERAGVHNGVSYYNDSIATIPEATMYAVKTLGNVGSLLLGGYDRGIDYKPFSLFLASTTIPYLLFTGAAGKRIMRLVQEAGSAKSSLEFFTNFGDMVHRACQVTPKGSHCLLSPAASSYDQFSNFEHRGNQFKTIVHEFFKSNVAK